MGAWAEMVAMEYTVGDRIRKSDILRKCMVMYIVTEWILLSFTGMERLKE